MADAARRSVLDVVGDDAASAPRPDDGRAASVMVERPKTLPTEVTVSQATAAFAGGHVHMLLLTRDGKLVGTLVPEDLSTAPAGTCGSEPALPLSRLRGRTVPPHVSAQDVERAMRQGGTRRLAVVATDGMLLGLMCLKSRGRGFCSDEDIASRSLGRNGHPAT